MSEVTCEMCGCKFERNLVNNTYCPDCQECQTCSVKDKWADTKCVGCSHHIDSRIE